MPLLARLHRALVLVLVVSLLGACAGTNGASITPEGINDPNEDANRRVHEFNRSLDRALVRPAGVGYTNLVPDGIEDGITNFALNLEEPKNVVNSLLQGNLRGAGVSLFSFVTNTTLGFGGFIDATRELGLPENDTDFGETLYVWGVGEGNYIELPLLGPSTERATVGLIVDLFTNPLNTVFDDRSRAFYLTPAGLASGLSARGRFTDTIDSILYESADSYAQARLIYLQNRRFRLGDAESSTEIDPFELDTEGF
ncbi:MAG: VacJ family lipoprotein [Pseudomonadota bacterium]